MCTRPGMAVSGVEPQRVEDRTKAVRAGHRSRPEGRCFGWPGALPGASLARPPRGACTRSATARGDLVVPFLRRLRSPGSTPAKELAAWLAAEQRVLDALVDADGLAAAAPAVLEALGTGSRWVFGAVWVPDARGERLRCLTTWSAPDFTDPLFREQSERLTLSPGQGLPGSVWVRRAPLSLPALPTEGDFPRAQAARDA